LERGEYRLESQNKNTPFSVFCKRYLEYSKDNKSENTYTRDKVSTKNLIEFFGRTPLQKLTPWQIEKYKRGRRATVKQATINRELACLKNMFTKAIEWGLTENNPAKRIKLYKETLLPIRPLTGEEEKRLLEIAEMIQQAPHLKPILLVALNTGMRLGEILNLRWADINLEEQLITLTKTKNREIRYVDLNRTALTALKGWKKEGRDDIFVFCDCNGKPFGSIKTAFNRAREKAGIPRSFRFHDLRHTFASRLVMIGVDLRTVQELMGHKTMAMTMRYSHLTPDHRRRAVEKLEKRAELVTYRSQYQKAHFEVGLK
jgi:integrase